MKAMILAAGFGTRLGQLTKNTPKCLIDINGKPIIRLVAESLHKAGVKEVIINLHYLPEQVQDYCSSALRDLFHTIEFSTESEILGTGGGLKAAQAFFEGQQYFYLVNADIYSDFNLKLLTERTKLDSETLAVLAVMNRQDSSYLSFDSNLLFTGWVRAQQSQELAGSQNLAFCGQQLLSTKIFQYLDQIQDKSFSIIEAYCLAQSKAERIYAHDIEKASWFDMGTNEQLQALRQYLMQVND